MRNQVRRSTCRRRPWSFTASVVLGLTALVATAAVITFVVPVHRASPKRHFSPEGVRPWDTDLYREMQMTKGPESTAQFLTLALSESDTEKIIGLALLGEVGDPDYPGVREVVGRELSSRNYGVRIQAINAVGRLGYREYLPRIYQLLMTGHEEAERILEWVPYLPMLPYLEKRYASWDKDAKELFGLFPDHWLLSGMRDATYNFLMENIDNPDPRYAAAVITAMGSTGDKSSFLPLIVSKMTSSADGRVQKAIIESIRQLADCPEEASILNKVELGGWLRIRADQVLRFLKWKDENKRR